MVNLSGKEITINEIIIIDNKNTMHQEE